MHFQFNYNIDQECKSNFTEFYNSLNWVAIEQHPLWWKSIEPSKKICWFTAQKDGLIFCSAIIEERGEKFIRHASIQFGPLFRSNDALLLSLEQICLYYSRLGFVFLTVQLSLETGADADYIEYNINKTRKPVRYFDRENWSSVIIDLSLDLDVLLRNMSKGHKSDIKKAQKSGLRVSCDFTGDHFDAFISIYRKMHQFRGLKEHKDGSAVYLKGILDFFEKHKAGRFFLVYDDEQNVIGGIAIVYQNKTVRYFKGAADPDSRNLPVLHLAITEGIKSSKAEGYAYFDLWGYNHFVTEDDQVFFINRFKKGFGGSYIFYPKKMYFIFKPIQYKLYRMTKAVYQRFVNKK